MRPNRPRGVNVSADNKNVKVVELYDMVATQSLVSVSVVNRLSNILFDIILSQLKNGQTVSIRGFGTFKPTTTPIKNYKMPDSNSSIVAGGKPKVAFKVTKNFGKEKPGWKRKRELLDG